MEVEFEDRVVVVDVDSICKIQALWRGASSRKRLREVQREFLETVRDVEGNDDMQVTFAHGPLCVPSLTSKKKLYTAKESSKRYQKHKNSAVKRSSCDHEQSRHSDLEHSRHSVDVDAAVLNDGCNEMFKNRDLSCAQEQETTLKARKGAANKEYAQNSVKGAPVNDSESDQDEFYSVKDSESYQGNLRTNSNKPEESPPELEIMMPEQPEETLRMNDNSDNNKKEDRIREDVPQVDMDGEEEDDEFIKMLHARKDQVGAEELEALRGHVAMELLWVQQAITSRKQYLRLKDQMTDAALLTS